MKKFSVKKLALAGMFCALCVVGSVFSFPMFGSKCAPVQHMVNVLCAVLLGPWWGVGVAFVASLLRNILGLGSLMAFPGSMFGALLCGLVYAKTKNLIATLVGEVFGTSILGGLCAYPVAICLMGKSAGDIAFYAYIVPFLISTAVGAVIALIGDVHDGKEIVVIGETGALRIPRIVGMERDVCRWSRNTLWTRHRRRVGSFLTMRTNDQEDRDRGAKDRDAHNRFCIDNALDECI